MRMFVGLIVPTMPSVFFGYTKVWANGVGGGEGENVFRIGSCNKKIILLHRNGCSN